MIEEKEFNSKLDENTIADNESTIEAEETFDLSNESGEERSDITTELSTVNVIKTNTINSSFTNNANTFNAMVKMPKINDSSLTAVVRANESMKALTGATDAIRHLVENSTVKEFSEIVIKNIIPQYTFKSAVLENISCSMVNSKQKWSIT